VSAFGALHRISDEPVKILFATGILALHIGAIAAHYAPPLTEFLLKGFCSISKEHFLSNKGILAIVPIDEIFLSKMIRAYPLID
jgi:hypothetical protein